MTEITPNDNLKIQEHDSTVIRGLRVNFFDDVEIYYTAEMLDWEDFRNNPKRKDIFTEKILGCSSRKYDSEIWDEKIKDCLYVSKDFGKHDKLIIICAEENWLQEELFFVPAAVLGHRKDTDIIVLKEEIKNNTKPFMHNMIMGLNSKYNTFEKVCKLLRDNYIKEHYKKSVVIAGGDVLLFGLALAQEFSDILTNNGAFLYDGITTYSWYDSTFVQLCHHMSYKAEYMYKKTGKIDHATNMMAEVSDAMFVLKCGYFNRHKINKRIISPFKYITDHPSLDVTYYHWKDGHHIDWLRENITNKPGTWQRINVKDENPPAYTFNEKLPIYLRKKLDK